AGTAIGAAIGALAATYFHASVWWFGVAVFVVGVLCFLLRIQRSAQRYASITVVMVMLIGRSTNPQSIAIHRFFEVSIGIAVGLLLFAFWPNSNRAAAGTVDEAVKESISPQSGNRI